MDLSHKLPAKMDFTRYTVPVEITFVNGNICCEWCNMSFRNRKGHIECPFSHEEIFSPNSTVGEYCPLRKEVL